MLGLRQVLVVMELLILSGQLLLVELIDYLMEHHYKDEGAEQEVPLILF